MSERRTGVLLGANRRMVRYVKRRVDDGPLRAKLEQLAAEHRRYGHRRLAILVRREGMVVNRKRLLRVYRTANLQVRKRASSGAWRSGAAPRRRRLAASTSVGRWTSSTTR
jgi:putative transposase